MDINDLGPFHSNVWGTWNEGFSTIITVIAAYFAYQTFRSQRIATTEQAAATRDQVRVNNLTLLTMQRAAIPKLECVVESGNEAGYQIVLSFNFNGAYNITFNSEDEEYLVFSIPNKIESLAMGEKVWIRVKYSDKYLDLKRNKIQIPKFISIYNIYFETYLKVAYHQKLSVFYGGHLRLSEAMEINVG